MGIKIYQIENELNEAFLTTLYDWRVKRMTMTDIGKMLTCIAFRISCDDFGGDWRDFKFLTRLIETLHLAVKDEDPSLLTTMNFHTDIPLLIHERLKLVNPYDSIKAWEKYLDIVSFDSYPNYYVANPLRSNVLDEVFTKIKLVTSKPVLIMELGYPVARNISQHPPEHQYTEQNQALFIRESFQICKKHNCAGYIYFGTWASEGISIPQGGYTSEDVAILSVLGKYFKDGDLISPITFLIRNMDRLEHYITRLPVLLKVIEHGWGIVDEKNRPLLGFHEMKKQFRGL